MIPQTRRFAGYWFLLAIATATWAAPASKVPSEEKARQALAVLQSDASPKDKAMACKTLAIFGTPAAVPALAPLLSDEALAAWARTALEAIPGPASDAALRGAMGRLEGRPLVGVINSLGVRGDAQALDALATKLKDADTEVASAAAVALGRIGGNQAARALETSLAQAPTEVRSAAAEGLILCAERCFTGGQTTEAVRLYDAVRQANVSKHRMLEATRGAILAREADGIPLLLETLRVEDKALFGMGLRAARELPGPSVTEALAAELAQTRPDRQSPLLLALTDRGDAAVWPAVFAAVRQGPKNLRLVAIGVLNQRGNLSSVPALLAAAADPDTAIAKAAKTALSRMPGKEVDAELASRLPQASGVPRRVLIELAGQRSIAVAVPELIKATRDAEAATRAAATRALGQTVGPADLGALTGLMAQAQSADEVSAVEAALESACTRIPDKAACAEQLLASLPASAAPARCSTLRLLGVTGTPKALEGVRAALKNDADGAVRDTAFRVLADWPDASALASLLDVFRTTQDETRRTLALRNSVRLLRLGEHSGPSTVGTYRELMAGARSVDDRKMILAGLSGVADPAALKLVEPLLSEASVQAEAEVAALSIARGLMGSSPAEAKAAASKLQAESKTPATRDRAAQIVRQIEQMEDYLTAWQVSGPYTEAATGATLFATAFPPEQPEAKAACAWRLLPAGTQPSRPWMLDLRAALSGERRVGYARTWVYSERAQAARIEFGTDDGHKLWLNGALIAQADRGGAAVPGDFNSSVQLRQGWNELLLKVIQDTGPWEFCLRLRTAAGDKLEGLRIRPVPPG